MTPPWIVRNLHRAQWNLNLSAKPLLQLRYLIPFRVRRQWIPHSLVRPMSELLRFKAHSCMELHFEELSTLRIAPPAVYASILVVRPCVPELDFLEAATLQPFRVANNARSVSSVIIKQCISYAILDVGQCSLCVPGFKDH